MEVLVPLGIFRIFMAYDSVPQVGNEEPQGIKSEIPIIDPHETLGIDTFDPRNDRWHGRQRKS